MGYASLAEALARGKGREIAFRCPVHDDHQASASVNPAKGLWVCYACGARGTTEGVWEAEDTRFADDVEELLGHEQRIYSERWLDQFDAGPVHPYWLGRFAEATCRHFRLGYDHSRGAPVYPMRDNAGRVLGVVRRSLLDYGPKYLYPRGVNKSQLLFNYSPAQVRRVDLVEGAADAMACWEVGYGEDYAVFGLYGSMLHPAQIALLHRTGATQIGLLLDNDDAGRKAISGHVQDGRWVPGIGERLIAEGFDVLVPDWSLVHAKDVAELPLPTRRTLLDSV